VVERADAREVITMRIGILADSHGRAGTTAAAVRTLLDAGADLLLHLGDIETESVIDELVGHDARIVFGNCDYEADRLTRYAELVGVTVDHPMGRLQVDSQTIAFTHGHVPRLLDEAIRDGVDYLLHGHTHQLRDERIQRTRVINPGALFRANRYTAALLEPETQRLTIHDVRSTS
jgi:hypothetical protein